MQMWIRFFKAILKGEWKLSPMSWLAAIGMLIYVVSPIDLIPELVLPFVGYIDDLGVWGIFTVLVAREKNEWEASLREGSIEI
jgi:uncharacterized membrane protein YkvA (DUF1232 family)